MKIRLASAVGFSLACAFLGWTLAKAQIPATATAPVKVESLESPLKTLDWLVGDWVGTQDDQTIEFNCNFAKNDAFLIRSFKSSLPENQSLSGMQVIAWDPSKASIRSWTFDSNGGFGEEAWSQNENRYTIRSTYTLPDGGKASALNVFTVIDDQQCSWKSVNREIDGELQPELDEIVLVRKTEATKNAGAK